METQLSTNLRTRPLASAIFIFSIAMSCSGNQIHAVSFLSSDLSGAVISDMFGVYCGRKLTMPSRRCRSCLFCGLGISKIASIFSGSGLNPLAVMMLPKYLTSFTHSWIFSLLNLMFRSLARSRTLMRVWSCSSLSLAAMMMSS